jgi:hypothetical protein
VSAERVLSVFVLIPATPKRLPMHVETSSHSMDHPLVTRLCRFTTLDKVALIFAAIFLFGVAAVATLAAVAIGEAPQGRLWSLLATYAALGLGVGIVAPWALCRMLHAAGHAARFVRERRVARAQALPPAAFLQSRTA